MISACEFCSIVENNIAREEAEQREEEVKRERELFIAKKKRKYVNVL